MALRPIWRGHLRLALVSCPVALYNARHDRAAIRFNLINPDTGNRIRMVTQDAETEKEVERRNLVKGYEFRKGPIRPARRRRLRERQGRKLVGDDDREIRRGGIRSIRSTTIPATTWRRTARPDGMSMPCCARPSPRPARRRWRAW